MASRGSNYPSQPSSYKTRTQRAWQEGDIAFLKCSDAFSDEDKHNLITSGYLPVKATCHPVIVLKAGRDRAIITPVSAYNTTANGLLPPWRQPYHRSKDPDDFRAFVGTQRPNGKHAALTLADPNMSMPKPRASWVYIKSFWCVPYSVLGWFNKAPALLRVSENSITQLRGDMARCHKSNLQDALARFNASTVTLHPAGPAPAAALRPTAQVAQVAQALPVPGPGSQQAVPKSKSWAMVASPGDAR